MFSTQFISCLDIFLTTWWNFHFVLVFLNIPLLGGGSVEWVRTCKFYSLRKFQIHTTVLLTTVIMFYIRTSELTRPRPKSFYSFTDRFLHQLLKPLFYSVSLSLIYFLISHVSDTMQCLFYSVFLTHSTKQIII